MSTEVTEQVAADSLSVDVTADTRPPAVPSPKRRARGTAVILPKRIYIKNRHGNPLTFIESPPWTNNLLFLIYDNLHPIHEFEATQISPSQYTLLPTTGGDYIHRPLYGNDFDTTYYANTDVEKFPAYFNVTIARGNVVYLKDEYIPPCFMCSPSITGLPWADEYLNADSEMQIFEASAKKEIFDVQYDLPGAKVHDAAPLIALSTSVRNDSDGDVTQTLTYSYEKWAVGTWNHAAGVELGTEMSFKAGIPFIASTKWKISLSSSYSHVWGKEEGTRQTVTSSTSVTVPPKKKARATIIVRNAEIDVGFTCTQKVLWSNGKTEVSEKNGVYNNVDSWHVDVELTNWEDL